MKDAERFASEIIPQYFNHSNFSSFVRQLNFYGFRKIKADPLRLKDARVSEESKYWKFRHEKFQKDRKDLLVLIRKNEKGSNEPNGDVDALKAEVNTLRAQLTNATNDILELKAMVANLVKHQASSNLKRNTSDLQPLAVMSEVGKESFGDPIPDLPTTLGELPPLKKARQASLSSFSIGSFEEDVLSSLMKLDDHDELKTKLPEVAPPSQDVDPILMDQLKVALARLPRELQVAFVNRIVAFVTDSDSFKMQVEAMTTLAVAAADEAKRRLEASGRHVDDPTLIPLATAVLGAYLSKLAQQSAVEPEAPVSLVGNHPDAL